MTTLTLDPTTAGRFKDLRTLVSVCDAEGHVLGHFVPLPSEDEALEPQIDDAELRRREAEGGGRSLSEILADLAARP